MGKAGRGQFARLRVRRPPSVVEDGRSYRSAKLRFSVGPEALLKDRRHRFFFGWRSDPFFFRRKSAFQSPCSSRGRLLQRQNVCSIVIRIATFDSGAMSWEFGSHTRQTSEGWIQGGNRAWANHCSRFPPRKRREKLTSAWNRRTMIA